jgi:hypothetical protein
MRNVYEILVGIHEGKRQLVIPRRKWEDNIKMDPKEKGFEDGAWILIF